MKIWACIDDAAIMALEAKGPTARRLRGQTASVSVADGIAIIQIRGTITKDGSELGPATIDLVEQVKWAAENENVRSIILSIDSPGGHAEGIQELASVIAEAATVKQVIANIDGLGASAAYWLASQCSRIFATSRTDNAGSIGTYQLLTDISGLADRSGIKIHRLRTGPLKGIGAAGVPINEQEIEYIQKRVNYITAEFVMAVARGRKIGADHVRGLATGEVFPAPEAVRNGLIDGIKTLDEIVSLLTPPNVLPKPAQKPTPPIKLSGYSAMTRQEIADQYCEEIDRIREANGSYMLLLAADDSLKQKNPALHSAFESLPDHYQSSAIRSISNR